MANNKSLTIDTITLDCDQLASIRGGFNDPTFQMAQDATLGMARDVRQIQQNVGLQRAVGFGPEAVAVRQQLAAQTNAALLWDGQQFLRHQ
jgi:hypothetical protein